MDNYQGRSQWRSIRMWMTGMVLAHALAAMLLTASSVHAAMPPVQSVALNLFFVLALMGHFVGIGAAVGLLAMFAAACARRPRWSVGFGIGAFSLALCILLVDTKVYALYRFHLNGMVVNMVFGGALGDNLGLPPAGMGDFRRHRGGHRSRGMDCGVGMVALPGPCAAGLRMAMLVRCRVMHGRGPSHGRLLPGGRQSLRHRYPAGDSLGAAGQLTRPRQTPRGEGRGRGRVS